MSERMACRLVGLSRSAYRRPLNADTVTDPDRALRDWLRAWAKSHPRYGYRRGLLKLWLSPRAPPADATSLAPDIATGTGRADMSKSPEKQGPLPNGR